MTRKKKLQANITHEHECKNLNKIITSNPTIYKNDKIYRAKVRLYTKDTNSV